MGYWTGRRRDGRKLQPLLVGVLLGVLAGGTAQAASNRHAQERAARKACLSGDYQTGVSILSDLFVDTKDPTYIFNQGRCFEQNRRYEDAIGRFQEYLRAGKRLESSAKAEAEKHIADCQELLAKQTVQTAPPPAPPPPAPIVQELPAATATATSPVPGVSAQAPATTSPGNGASLRLAGIVTASVGVAAMATAIILNLKVNSMSSDMESVPGGYSSSKESDRQSLVTWGWIGYGVGSGCIATGAILYILGARNASGQSGNLALLPTFAPDQAGAVLKGAF
jgi:hypothetical protein